MRNFMRNFLKGFLGGIAIGLPILFFLSGIYLLFWDHTWIERGLGLFNTIVWGYDVFKMIQRKRRNYVKRKQRERIVGKVVRFTSTTDPESPDSSGKPKAPSRGDIFVKVKDQDIDPKQFDKM